MANSLLDFVMSVVRDPDAAAQYAANPTQAIADASLTDVTSADVDNLIPVVAESMASMAPLTPSAGPDFLGESVSNVWASGAATAAFDAFDDHLPVQGGDVIADQVPTVATVVDGFDGADVPSVAAASEPSLVMDVLAVEDVPALDGAPLADLFDEALPTIDDHPHPQEPGFDVFS